MQHFWAVGFASYFHGPVVGGRTDSDRRTAGTARTSGIDGEGGARDASLPDDLDDAPELEFRKGRFARVAHSAARSLSIRIRLLGPDYLSVAISLKNLGKALFAEGWYKTAQKSYRCAFELAEREPRPDSKRPAKCPAKLGKTLTAQHRDRKAGQVWRRPFELWAILGGAFEEGVTLGNLALLAAQCREYAKAEELYRCALARLNPSHLNAPTALTNLADVLRIRRRYNESRRLFRQALVPVEEYLGGGHPDRAAMLLRGTHRRAEADALLPEPMRIRHEHALQGGGAWLVDLRVQPETYIVAGRSRERE